jgi:hypothetical protein
VAGVGGFGALADAALESSARILLARGVPARYRLSMTYGSWRSPYCPDPRQFHATTLERLNEGAWFWVYIGHGHPHQLDRVRVPGAEHHILANRDVSKLRCRNGPPIALFLACYIGAFDADPDCLGEQMLRQPGGPTAVIAGSRVTMPYAMTLLSTGLMDECFENRCPTLGEALLRAKRKLLEEPGANDSRRAVLDLIARMISPAPDKLDQERAEHVLLFNLLGDPLLKLRYPKAVELTVAATGTAGQPLRVSGTSPIDGRASVELVVRCDRLTFTPPMRAEYPTASDELAEFQTVYERANDRRLASTDVKVENGQFTVRLDVPDDARGACHVRLFVAGSDDFAAGSADVEIKEPAQNQ